jgi:hypothetical protein
MNTDQRSSGGNKNILHVSNITRIKSKLKKESSENRVYLYLKKISMRMYPKLGIYRNSGNTPPNVINELKRKRVSIL